MRKCVESIPKMEGVEIIIVDDNSDLDNTDKLNFPGIDEQNVRVIFSNGGKGAGAARNMGLKIANGKWLIFADSDDFFHENISQILKEFKKDNSDIIFFKLEGENLLTGEPDTSRTSGLNTFIDNALKNNDFDILRYQHGYPVGKMIKRSLVMENNIQFQEVPNGNDLFFSMLTGHAAKNFKAVDKTIYVVTSRKEHSLDKEKIQSYINLFNIGIQKIDFLKKINKERLGYPLVFAFWRKILHIDLKEGLRKYIILIKACGFPNTVSSTRRFVLFYFLGQLKKLSPDFWILMKKTRSTIKRY